MKIIQGFAATILGLVSSAVFAGAISGVPMRHAEVNLKDKPALQRGAKIYMNYCAGCHSLQYVRYSQLGRDIGIFDKNDKLDTKLLQKNFIFTGVGIHHVIDKAMPESAAKSWFGVSPPDLTLETRIRGEDWVLTYLTSFYKDANRPLGTNNWIYPDVGMPNVLAHLQGEQVPVFVTKQVPYGESMRTVKEVSHLQLVKSGSMSEQQFNSAMNDLVTFLAYVAEPAKLQRIHIGIGVMIFLLMLIAITYALKREYWKDIK